MSGRTARRRVVRVTVPAAGSGGAGGSGGAAGVTASARADLLAAEEPLGIRVDGTALTMTMRTPGDDVELAAGFLVGEAIVRGRDDIAAMKVCDGTTCGHLDHTATTRSGTSSTSPWRPASRLPRRRGAPS